MSGASDINKIFLQNTIRDVESHNRREVHRPALSFETHGRPIVYIYIGRPCDSPFLCNTSVSLTKPFHCIGDRGNMANSWRLQKATTNDILLFVLFFCGRSGTRGGGCADGAVSAERRVGPSQGWWVGAFEDVEYSMIYLLWWLGFVCEKEYAQSLMVLTTCVCLCVWFIVVW